MHSSAMLPCNLGEFPTPPIRKRRCRDIITENSFMVGANPGIDVLEKRYDRWGSLPRLFPYFPNHDIKLIKLLKIREMRWFENSCSLEYLKWLAATAAVLYIERFCFDQTYRDGMEIYNGFTAETMVGQRSHSWHCQPRLLRPKSGYVIVTSL